MRPMNVGTLALVWLVLAGASTARAEIVVDSWGLAHQVQDALGPDTVVQNTTVTLPYSDVLSAADGSTSAQGTYELATGADWASFDFIFDHERSGSESVARSFGGISFTLSEPLHYVIQGSFALAGSGYIDLSVSLTDTSTYPDSVHVYRGRHESNATADESFTLGQAGGDLVSEEAGSVTGTLQPGVEYDLHYYYSISNNPYIPGSAATADGMLSFTLDAAPEPSSLTLLALGAIAVLRRRR
ncbi:MAG TPA: PEP-CTERM sorting domain-containing protein [Phycisphaerae bacterium]|nr:PEP-CTERM sorting domain-containing protein [Phycisphaerae bacterium]